MEKGITKKQVGKMILLASRHTAFSNIEHISAHILVSSQKTLTHVL